MANKSPEAINTFSAGMNLDLDKSLLKNNQYRYAENVRCITDTDSSTGSLTNIEGPSLVSGVSIPDTETIIATDTIRDCGVIFSTLGGKSTIPGSMWNVSLFADHTQTGDVYPQAGSLDTSKLYRSNGLFITTPDESTQNSTKITMLLPYRNTVEHFNSEIQSITIYDAVYSSINGVYTKYNGADPLPGNYFYVDTESNDVFITKDIPSTSRIAGPSNYVVSLYENNVQIDTQTNNYTYWYNEGKISVEWYVYSQDDPVSISGLSINEDTMVATVTLASPFQWNGSSQLELLMMGVVSPTISGYRICNRIDDYRFYINITEIIRYRYTPTVYKYEDYGDGKTKLYINGQIGALTVGNTYDIERIYTYEGEVDINTGTALYVSVGELIIDTVVIENNTDPVFIQIRKVTTNKNGDLVLSKLLPEEGLRYIDEEVTINTVCRYEDDDNIKVYWTDGINPIRMINIAEESYSSISDLNYFNIKMPLMLDAPEIVGLGTGRLNAGTIQYAYQLSSIQGSLSRLSLLSPQISLSKTTQNTPSSNVLGDDISTLYGEPTGKSVKVRVNIDNPAIVDRIRLISIYSYNYNEIPVISIVKDIPTNGKSTIILEDGGVSAVGELTLDEFNAIGGDIPIASRIESKDDILFAADIKENSFDENYDTRAYQFKNPSTTIPGYTIPGYYTSGPSAAVEFNVSTNTQSADWNKVFKFEIGTEIFDNTVSSSGWTITAYYATASGVPQWINLTTSPTINLATKEIRLNSFIDNSDVVHKFRFTAPVRYIEPIVVPPQTSGPAAGLFKILDNDGTPSVDMPLGLASSIIESHGCIHPEIYTVESYRDITYKYDSKGNLGGEGPNVSYLFTNTKFIESYSDVLGKNTQYGIGGSQPNDEKDRLIDRRYPRIGDVKRSISNLYIANSDGTTPDRTNNLKNIFGIDPHEGPINYANPLLANKFKSYQRDEIYRFAAVLYNSKGEKSPAKWIADIRFPAGYYRDTNWSAAIFEMPTENYAANGDYLNLQELLVKPLGLTFKFKNVPQSVTKIEIVRAKRDINNKTIYGQGVIQKLGTYYSDYDQDDDENIGNKSNKPIDGALLPHPVIAMGYNYSIIGPTLEISDGGIRKFVHGFPNRIGGLSQNTETYKFYNIDEYTIDTGFLSKTHPRVDFTKHAYSPYFSNRENFMFINPETSYYGETYASQIENNIGDIKMNIVDIIYPVSTPALTSTNTNYYGKGLETTFYNGTLQHSMYFGADINKNNLNTNTISSSSYLSTFGLIGVEPKLIVNQNDTSSLNDVISGMSGSVSMPSDRFDVYLLKGDELKNNNANNFVRVHIATGGFTHVYDSGSIESAGYWSGANEDYSASRPHSDNGAGGVPNSSVPPLFTSKNIIDGCIGGTFKYFRSINDKHSADPSIKYVYQNGGRASEVTITVSENGYTNKSTIPLSFSIDEIKYSGDITPGAPIDQIGGLFYKNIGGRLFLNWSRALTYGDDRFFNEGSAETIYANTVAAYAATKVQGIHGDGLVFNVGSTIPSIGMISGDRYAYSSGYLNYDANKKQLDNFGATALSTYVMNIKSMNSSIYGGNTYFDRQFTEYISTGFHKDVSNSQSDIITFGGDTFISIFDYSVVRATDPFVGVLGADSSDATTAKLNKSEVIAAQTKHIGAMIPLESSINLHLVSSKSYVNQDCAVGVIKDVGVNLILGNSGGTYQHVQSLPQYKYNSAYSTEQTAIGYVSKLDIDESNNVFDCRVINSGVKSNDELYDNWSVFKVDDYIDVDTRYGKITRLKTFDNRLYFWQEHAVGILSVNERSLIQDNNTSALALGTGGILTRFDYISNSNGLHKNSINSLHTSPSALYWYDHDRGELITMGKGSESLSKAKGIQSMLNKNKNVIEYNVPITYDRKYNEVIFSFYGISDPKLLD